MRILAAVTVFGLAFGGTTGAIARDRAPAASGPWPASFFAGRTHSEGAFVDGAGQPQSRLSGDTAGGRERDGSTVFRQQIRFDDGTRRDRTWRIVPVDAHRLVATATDIVGFAQGEIDGRVLHLSYTVRTDPQNPLLDVDFDQTLTLLADGRTVQNDSLVRKFGFVVRRLNERFVRRGRVPAARAAG